MKAMIVDDHRMIRGILSKGLKRLGFTEVVSATNGQEALDLLPDAGVDMVFLDWHMPAMDGLETLKRMQSTLRLHQLPVIMVTSESHSDKIKEAIQVGVSQYLIKPFEDTKLREKVHSVLSNHPAFRQRQAEVASMMQNDVDFAQPFVDATLEVLGTMASLPITPHAICTVSSTFQADVTSVIGMLGTTTTGTALLGFPRQLASKVVRAFLDESGETEEGIEDGIEEILNMIVGKARASLANTLYEFDMSLPTIVRGANHEMPLPKEPCQTWIVPFEVYGQEFILELRLELVKKNIMKRVPLKADFHHERADALEPNPEVTHRLLQDLDEKEKRLHGLKQERYELETKLAQREAELNQLQRKYNAVFRA